MSRTDEITRDEDGIRCTAIPTDDGYWERSGGANPDETCTICGRKTDGRYYVMAAHGGEVALHIEDAREFGEAKLMNRAGFIGGQSIGPTCRKRLPDEFVGDRKELMERLGLPHDY